MKKRYSSRKFLSLFLILFLAVGNVWAEDVTWEGPYGNFVTKKLSDNKTEITITQSTGSSSKTISCIKSSKQSYLSINGSGKYLKFIAPTGYTITNIQMVWMSGAANQALPILFGEEISAIGTVETKDNAVTITNGGFKMTSVIATNGGNNCDLPDNIVLPTGTKEVMIGRSGAYNNTDYATIGNVAATVKFRLAGSSGYFNTGVGTGSTPFIGRVVLTVVPEVSCDAANLTASNITSNGNQEAGTGITFSKVGTPASGDTWYWQTSATGTDKTYSASSSYTTATTAGSYTVYLRAYNSESDCWGTAASMTNTIYPAPSAMIHNTFAVNAAWGSTIATQDKANITNLNAMAAVGQSVGTGSDKAGLTQKIPSQSSEDPDKYMSLSFNVAAGKQLNVTSVVFDEQPITKTGTFKVSISDNQGSVTKTQTIASGSAGAPHTLTLDDDIVGSFKGTVTVKVWAYGWSDGYRFGNYFYVNGTIEEVEPPVTTTYTVTYNANGGSGEMAKTTNEIVTSTFTAPNGKMFKEWNTASDGNGTSYAAGEEVTDNLNLYAIWKDIQNFDVKFYPGYGENTQIGETQSVILDGKAEKPADPTREGYRFVGWSTDGTEANIKTIEDYVIIEATTFIAVWKQVYTVSFDLQGHGDAIDPQDIISGEKATKPADPIAIGYDFGGWFTDAACTAGNEFDFETPITAATELFAKWTEFEGCALLYPALNGDALHVGDNVSVQSGSKGATIAIVGMKADGSSIAYSTNGLSLNGGSADVISVTLNSDMAVGTKISVTLIAASTGSRGLNLLNSTGGSVAGGTKLGWDDATTGAEATFSYTVTASDGLDGTNIFRLQRSNSVYLKCLKVESCGAAITYHNLTSAVNIAGKGTVTLGASTVRECSTTTAEYSAIDPLYEFVNWTVSGAGASVADATANPATITVGTEDAVVTLNLRLIPIKFTVEYYDGATAMGTEQVVVNEHPTASEIVTAKRGYVFEGWATSSTATASDVINLNTITSDVATAIPLYAIYTAVPCVSEGTVFSMTVTDPAGTQYEENNDFGLEIGATYLGGKAYSGSKSTTKRIGEIDTNGEYSFNKNSDVAVKVALDCALQEGDVIIFTTSTKRELKIKKVVGTDLVTTSSKKYTIPAESPLIGEYDFYLMRDNSESTFKTLKVERPYTISFDMQGHGDAIEAQKLIAGDKVVEPTAPTADGWDFKGWYKESACTNAWDFENDVVAGTMALYAKWDVHVTNDATLKSLKYGSEAIALEDGVFEYNIGLPALTASVPALTAVANSATVHSLDIVDAAAFDVDGKATSIVTVVSEDETVTNVYTVNFSKMAELPQVNVTESTTWNFSAGGSTTLTNQSDIVLANLPGINNDANFNSQALIGSFNKLEGTYFQGSQLSFTTEVAGELTITFRGTNNNERHLQVCVGDGETVVADWNYQGSGESAQQTQSVIVPAGKVTLKAFEGEVAQNARIYNMIFNATPDYIRDVRQGYYGTICLPNKGQMIGAAVYEIAYMDYKDGAPYKIYFDEILNGKMEAGVPYVFLPNEGYNQLIVTYTAIIDAPAAEVKGLCGFIGASATDEYQIPSGVGNYIIQNNQYREVLAGADARIVSNRAYIKLSEIPGYNNPLYVAPAPAPGRKRIAMGTTGAQVATGVDQVQGGEAPTKMIINGQLFILRGEKMYDAQGKLVK